MEERPGEGAAVLTTSDRAVLRSLAVARAYMHARPCIVETAALAASLDHPEALEDALGRLEAQGYLLVQWRPGRVMGSAFVTQDGLRLWAQSHLEQGTDPLPEYTQWAEQIEALQWEASHWGLEDLAARLQWEASPLMAQLRVMEALGRLKANKKGQGVILSVQLR